MEFDQPWESSAKLSVALKHLADRSSSAASETNRSTPTSILKRGIYALAQLLIKRSRQSVALDLVRMQGLRPSMTQALRECVYHHLLKSVPRSSSRAENERIAYELQYAARHHITDAMLIGFIAQSSGSASFKNRVEAAGHYEDWFALPKGVSTALDARPDAALEAKPSSGVVATKRRVTGKRKSRAGVKPTTLHASRRKEYIKKRHRQLRLANAKKRK